MRWIAMVGTVLVGLLALRPAMSAPVGGSGFLGAPQIQVSIIELPLLPGHLQSFATSINDRGLVVGYSNEIDSQNHLVAQRAVYWANPPTRILPQPVGNEASQALGVNNAGLIGGLAYNFGGFTHAFLWGARGVPRPLPEFPGGPSSRVLGINERGYAVGRALDVRGLRRAAFWYDSRILDMGSLPGFPESNANAINNRNFSTGATVTPRIHAIFWNGTHPEALAELPGGTTSSGFALNDFNEVVGSSGAADGHSHAVLWRGLTAPEQLPGPPAGSNSFAQVINGRGIIAGSFTPPGGKPHGALWVDGFFFDLDAMIPESLGWSSLLPIDANERDQIVGSGVRDGRARAFAMAVRRL